MKKSKVGQAPFGHAIVLTGGIATGKSTVAQMFKQDGWKMIDADTIAHIILTEQKEWIIANYGEAILKEGKIDRKALGSIVFADTDKRKKLENHLHPMIRERIFLEAEKLEQDMRPYIIDIPLFFESGQYPIERTLLIYTPAEIQLKRLMKREGYSKPEAKLRIDAQLSIEDKKELAHYILDNSGTVEELQTNYEILKERMRGEMK